jgi:signal transduction histidine kinase
MVSVKNDINSTISDLDWYIKTFRSDELIRQLLDYFKSETSIPGVIILENGQFLRLISKTKFHKMMSQQYMFELFNKRRIESLLDDYEENSALILPYNTSILDAANLAIKRNPEIRYDPVIIKFDDDTYGMVDFFQLLIAQVQLHKITLDSLKEANEFKKDILGILAHDLRNPINSIQGFSQILSGNGGEHSEVQEYAGYINTSARQMNALLAEMLHSASLDATEISICKTCFDVVSILKTIILNFSSQASAKNQQISFEIINPELRKDILADKLKIQEVLENIVSNAIKYSDCGGRIITSVVYSEGIISISVADSGPGFTEEDKRKLFGKFQRLSAKPTAGESSTGLGLYISKKIVELHMGTITALPAPGKGSVFTIDLPVNIQS